MTPVSDSLGGKVAGLTMLGLLGIIGVLWVRRHWHDPAPAGAPESAPGDDV